MKNIILTLELVPSSSWLTNVRSAVSRKEWDYIRHQVYDKAWHTCEICGGAGTQHPVECHEIWHYNDKKLIQKLENMIALCPNCHSVKHYGLAQINKRVNSKLKHFMKVNKISKIEAEKYISAAFTTWADRSRKTWKIDISSLKEYGININKIKS